MFDLRQRNRLTLMRRVQATAVNSFTRLGYQAVTVEQVAAAADVSPVSVYRWFGSKTGLVLWDDYDSALLAQVSQQLTTHPPLVAIEHAVVTELDRIYDADRSLVLDRTRLVYAEPELRAASMADGEAMARALAQLIGDADPDIDSLHCLVLGRTAVAVLTSAVERWQHLDGAVPLAQIMHQAFEVLDVAS
jgi:AcrR family transcriptional regulator